MKMISIAKLALLITLLSANASDPVTPLTSGQKMEQKLLLLHIRLNPLKDAASNQKIIDDFIAAEGQSLVPDLIDSLHYLHEQSELRGVQQVLKSINPSPADALIAALNSEADPAQKAKLVFCLGAVDGPNVMPALRARLDDNSFRRDPPYRGLEGGPPCVGPVFREAYNAIIKKLDGASAIYLRRNSTDSDQRVEALKQRLATMDAAH